MTVRPCSAARGIMIAAPISLALWIGIAVLVWSI